MIDKRLNALRQVLSDWTEGELELLHTDLQNKRLRLKCIDYLEDVCIILDERKATELLKTQETTQ